MTSRFGVVPVLHVVQRSVAPTMGLCTDLPLYFRGNDFVAYTYRTQTWQLKPGGTLWFDTYFNGVAIRRWKRTAPLADLQTRIRYRGHLLVRLHVMVDGATSTVVDEIALTSATPTEHRWKLEPWDAVDDGILFLSFQALDDSTLDNFAFETATPPVRHVRLGICITHYDRRAQIVPAIARLKQQLLDDPDFADRVGLVVVDNSRNLDAAETVGATVLPNRNLGGAGGFARGMMHLNDDGGYTHALFMDDDASCEVESIRRSIALLAHATDGRTAIAGAMLLAREPFRQFESGARFEGLCRPLRHDIDLRVAGTLAWNEREQISDYGAWWFFAFPLASAVGYPYPYFVRGDDIDFSLRNDFDIVATNGVASWQEDFSMKHHPQTNYLDTRNHLMQVLHGHRGGRRLALYVSLRMFLIANLAGQYEMATAAVMALEDVQRGPEWFAEHADLAEPRARLQKLMRAERLRPFDPEQLRHAQVTGLAETRRRNLLRLATLNGHLIPQALFHRSPVRFPKGYVLPLRGTFRRRHILVFDELSGTGMTLEHSKRRFFANLWRYAKAVTTFAIRFPALAQRYRDAYPHLTSDAFWRGQFAAGAAAAPAPLVSAAAPTPRAAALVRDAA